MVERNSFHFLLIVGVIVLVGCSRESQTPANVSDDPISAAPSPSTTPETASQEVRKIPTADLPIGDYLPPLDGGRIEIPTPTGWTPLPRDSKYVVRFFKDDKNGLPRIEIIAEDKSFGGIDTVTEENVVQFASAVGENLQAQGKKMLEPVVPMVIGQVPCARYVLKVELKMPQGSVIAERQSLIVLNRGRAYSIQLLVLPNKLVADRDAAYAICAGMKFIRPCE